MIKLIVICLAVAGCGCMAKTNYKEYSDNDYCVNRDGTVSKLRPVDIDKYNDKHKDKNKPDEDECDDEGNVKQPPVVEPVPVELPPPVWHNFCEDYYE